MDLVLVTSGKRKLRRAAGLALGCLLLAVFTQLVLVALLCLVLPEAAPPGTCTGVIGQGRKIGDEWVPRAGWVFYVSSSLAPWSPPYPDRALLVGLHPRWGTWWVVGSASADGGRPVDPGPPVALTLADIPTWACDGLEAPPDPEFIGRWGSVCDCAFGWPFPAFAARLEMRGRPYDVRSRDVVFVTRPNRDAPLGVREPLGFLPTRVLWPGLAADLGVVAGVWASPLAVAAAVRAVAVAEAGAAGAVPPVRVRPVDRRRRVPRVRGAPRARCGRVASRVTTGARPRGAPNAMEPRALAVGTGTGAPTNPLNRERTRPAFGLTDNDFTVIMHQRSPRL